MKATVISVFKNKKYIVHYHYHHHACGKDPEVIESGEYLAPMMEIKLWKEKQKSISDRKVETQGLIVFATPEIIKAYTGEDIFKSRGLWNYDCKYLDIEFEWGERQYPYIPTYHPRDYISTEEFKFPRIISIGELYFLREL